jgi:hypothetical protein
LHQWLGKVYELLHHMGPVVADGVLLVMAVFFDRIDGVATSTQAGEQYFVGTGWKTIGM